MSCSLKTWIITFYSSNDSLPSGFWDNEGCNVSSVDQQSVTCQCNHLTHFAILLSPGESPPVSNYEKCIIIKIIYLMIHYRLNQFTLKY